MSCKVRNTNIFSIGHALGSADTPRHSIITEISKQRTQQWEKKETPDAPTASPNAGGREREEARTSGESEREGERKRGNNS